MKIHLFCFISFILSDNFNYHNNQASLNKNWYANIYSSKLKELKKKSEESSGNCWTFLSVPVRPKAYCDAFPGLLNHHLLVYW